MSKVRITQTKLGLYVDGRKVFFGPQRTVLFCEGSENVIDYIVEKERGYPLGEREVAFPKDGNPRNINPTNLMVLERQPDEAHRRFYRRIRQAQGKEDKLYRELRMNERIFDLDTRPLSAGSTKPLREQIIHIQRMVSKAMRKGIPEAEVRNIAANNIRRYRYDVKLSDIVFNAFKWTDL